jgi:DNA-binding transcriptional regulator GbsR (MarR family)
VQYDAQVFGNQFSEYRDNPIAQTKRALVELQENLEHRKHYDDFQRNMVYGQKVVYHEGLETVNELARLLNSF